MPTPFIRKNSVKSTHLVLNNTCIFNVFTKCSWGDSKILVSTHCAYLISTNNDLFRDPLISFVYQFSFLNILRSTKKEQRVVVNLLAFLSLFCNMVTDANFMQPLYANIFTNRVLRIHVRSNWFYSSFITCGKWNFFFKGLFFLYNIYIRKQPHFSSFSHSPSCKFTVWKFYVKSILVIWKLKTLCIVVTDFSIFNRFHVKSEWQKNLKIPHCGI